MTGKRKVVVFLPGFACESWIWRGVAGRLRGRVEPVFVDWPLERAAEAHSIEDFADWLEEAHAAALSRADALVGHSMGGLVATAFCARLSGARPTPRRTAREEHGSRARRPGPRLILVESFPHGIAPFFQNLSVQEEGSPLRERILSTVLKNIPRFSARLRKDLRTRSYAELSAAYDGPFAGIYGMRASSDPEEVRRALGWPSAVFARAELRFIPGSAHFPMLENPDATLLALEELLAS